MTALSTPLDLMLANVNKQLVEKEITLHVSDAAKDFLGEKGYNEEYGARPLRRVIQNMLEDRLSEDLLRGNFRSGDTIHVDMEGEELVIRSGEAVGALSGEDK